MNLLMNKLTSRFYIILGVFALRLLGNPLLAQERVHYTLKDDWKFTRVDDQKFANKIVDTKSWETVRVPHDWAIYGPFSSNNDKQYTAILQDGQQKATEHAGRTGGLPFVGAGWYRKEIQFKADDLNKNITLQFDGAMSNAEVFVNGKSVGNWPNGYNTFYFDISKYAVAGSNSIAVRLNNLPESSRWYPGAGLYRNVHVLITDKTKIAHWGTFVKTTAIQDEFATIDIQTELEVNSQEKHHTLVLESRILDKEKKIVVTRTDTLSRYEQKRKDQRMYIDHPKLWSVDHPNLYTLESKLYADGSLKDTYETTFGVRTIEIVANKGFYLNGKEEVFKGVCMHHDLGPLGGAINDAAVRRQIRILKDMGVNAIRTSHNMPSPELVRACDEMGMMLMAESFDEWRIPKVQNGYHLYFDQWAERDVVNLVRHYRNNPSIVMWCIGNEVPEQGSVDGSKVARFLQDIFHREDPTRPATQGMDNPDAVINSSFASTMEIAGFNYRPFKYHEAYKKLQHQLVLGTETASTLSSRGIYKFPVVRRAMAKYDDHQASSYDVEHCSWSDLPEDNFIQHEDLHYAMGEFVWTGFDYLGEPTPYYSDWPSHSSLFGIVDLAGIPKDRYYLYRSHWNKQAETLHILPHWNWEGREGDVTPVFVYTNHPKAELFINGKSQGIRTKDLSIKRDQSADRKSLDNFERQKRYRLMWMDTKYESGSLKVVAYDSLGNIAAVDSVVTAGKPYALKLEVDRSTLRTDGEDLAYITVSIVDKNGVFCPTATNEISFEVKGKGKYKAVANGDPTCLTPFQSNKMKAFSGKLVAIVEAGDVKGNITFEAISKGLKSKKAQILVK